MLQLFSCFALFFNSFFGLLSFFFFFWQKVHLILSFYQTISRFFFSLFEDAADKLCLEALLSFLKELGEAVVAQLYRLAGGGAGMSTYDYSGNTASVHKSRPPTNALHLYRLQQVLIRVVNSSRPLLHLLRVWNVVSPYLVQVHNIMFSKQKKNNLSLRFNKSYFGPLCYF